MSHKPIGVMSGVTMLGGITGYTLYHSVPSLIGALGIGSIMALSSMRIRDSMDGGLEAAALSSAALVVPTVRRAVITRGPIPITLAILATASTGYYGREWMNREHLL